MSGYLSGLLTTTTSRYASLRSLIPTSTSENDGETTDDTHLCRVLRAYYSEKQRPFPGWLPPDPKDKQVVQPVYTQSSSNIGAGYGGLQQGLSQNKLGSLWDSQPNSSNPPPPTSLRQQGRGVSSSTVRSNQTAGRTASYNTSQPAVQETVQARPLPSQRAGTYQTTPPGSSGGGTAGGSAQDRLKARLWGAARAASPGGLGQRQSSETNISSRPQASQLGQTYDRNDSYGTGKGADYEDSFLPGARAGGTYGGSGRSEKPFVAATSPWATTEDEFSGYGARTREPTGGGRQGQQGSGRFAGGLPSGPRSLR